MIAINYPLVVFASVLVAVIFTTMIAAILVARLTHFDRRYVQCGFTAEVDFVPGERKVQCSLYMGHKTNFHEYWPQVHQASGVSSPLRMAMQWRAR